MQPENRGRLAQIQRFSAVSRVACKVMMWLVAAGAAAGTVALLSGRGGTLSFFSVTLPIRELSIAGRLILLALTLATTTVMFLCFLHLHRLFENYSRGEIFTVGSAAEIRRVGVGCMLYGAANIVWAYMPGALLGNGPQHVLAHGEFIGIGVIIAAISRVMEMAADLQEENELTV